MAEMPRPGRKVSKGPNLKRRDSQMEKGLADDVQVTDAAADVANAAASRPRLQSLHEVVTRPPEDAAPTAAPAPGTPPNDIVSTPPLFLAPEDHVTDDFFPEEVKTTQPQTLEDAADAADAADAGPAPSLEDIPDEVSSEVPYDVQRLDEFPEGISSEVTASDRQPAANEKFSYHEEDFPDLDVTVDTDVQSFLELPKQSAEQLNNLYRILDALENQGYEDNDDAETDSKEDKTHLTYSPLLHTDDSDLPDLFAHSTNVPSYAEIANLRAQLRQDSAEDHLDDFEKEIERNLILVRSAEEIEADEKIYKKQRVKRIEKEADLVQKRQQLLMLQEEAAKKRLSSEAKKKLSEIRWKKSALRQRDRLQMDILHNSFKRAESQLMWALKRRQAEVETMYGDLTLADGQYGGAKGRRWKVEWEKTPQPVQIRMKCLRGVRDKLPRGRYVLMVSLYNRLGGNVLRWSNLKGQQWGGASLPVSHGGHFHDVEMKLNQSVFTVCPSKPDVRPGMILAFELFLLRGAVLPTDRVVAWGVFPISNSDFNIIEGKYKCAMIRGEMDPRIDKHKKLEEIINEDVDHWLCNFYFEVIKLPRYLGGQKEFEVELNFTSALLGHPDRLLGAEEPRDGEEPEVGVASTLSDIIPSTVVRAEHKDKRLMLNKSESTVSSENGSIRKLKMAASSTESLQSLQKRNHRPKKFKNKVGDVKASQNFNGKPMTTIGSRALIKRTEGVKTRDLVDSSDDDDDDEGALDDDLDDDLEESKEFLAVRGQAGMYYKRHLTNPVDVYQRRLYALLPKTALLLRRHPPARKLSRLEELQQHEFAVKPPYCEKRSLGQPAWERAAYARRQLLSELGLSQWRTPDFWTMILMFFFTFLLRVIIHYGGQILLLLAMAKPYNMFDLYGYTVTLNYPPTALYFTREEVAVTLAGPLLVILVFVAALLFSYAIQRFLGVFPNVLSKFVLAFGLQAATDPILILIIDATMPSRFLNLDVNIPTADAAKLWWHFVRSDGTGFYGLFLTVFLYLFTCFLGAILVYIYFLRLHNNGRLMDVYHRLTGDEEDFFKPFDLELSLQELTYICRRAEAWRGEEGERRKVTVYDYVWDEDEQQCHVTETRNTLEADDGGRRGKSRKETTTHVSIHTLFLDGLREHYRQFLRLPDGAIIEVLNTELSIPGLHEDIKKVLKIQNKRIATMMGTSSRAPSAAASRSHSAAGSAAGSPRRGRSPLSSYGGSQEIFVTNHRNKNLLNPGISDVDDSALRLRNRRPSASSNR